MSLISVKRSAIWLSFFVLMEAALPIEAWARAGGGGGSGKGGIVNLILFPICIAYSLFVSYLVYKKNRDSEQALARAMADHFWSPGAIKSRVKQVFFKVQEAWTARNQKIAKDCMSEKLFQEHKQQTDLMQRSGTRNVLENIQLNRARIVEVLDYLDDSKDQFWVHIEGSMIDYTINDKTGAVVDGNRNKAEAFKELWKFVRADHGWVLDEIDSSVQLTDLLNMNSITES